MGNCRLFLHFRFGAQKMTRGNHHAAPTAVAKRIRSLDRPKKGAASTADVAVRSPHIIGNCFTFAEMDLISSIRLLRYLTTFWWAFGRAGAFEKFSRDLISFLHLSTMTQQFLFPLARAENRLRHKFSMFFSRDAGVYRDLLSEFHRNK